MHEELAHLGTNGNGNGMVLVGRRQLRSNNSWMRNLPPLAKGKLACTVHVHPDDALRLGLADGEPAEVSSRTGAIELPVEVTDAVMPGVCSIPHGWGHDLPGVQLSVARAHAGANSQRARRHPRGRPALGQRDPQRHPRRARAGAGARDGPGLAGAQRTSRIRRPLPPVRSPAPPSIPRMRAT